MDSDHPCASTMAYMDRVSTRLDAYEEWSAESLEAAKSQLGTLKRELLSSPSPDEELSVTGVMLFESALAKLKETLKKLSSEHKDIHGAISKTGKQIDQNFTANFSGVVRGKLGLEEDAEKRRRINALVAADLLSQGHLDLAELLASESNLPLAPEAKEAAAQLCTLHEALERRDLEPPLAFVQLHREELEAIDSRLSFFLHRLRFVQLLQSPAPVDLSLLRAYLLNFGPFLHRFPKEASQTMAAAMYAGGGLDASPYRFLLSEDLWREASLELGRDACLVLGVAAESRLAQILRAGTKALPALLKLRDVMAERDVVKVWGGEELPMDVDLGPESRFHSVFACPILRQQTTAANPPCRLTCGHVISRDALHKLATNNRTRLKCPYCPLESLVADAKCVQF